MNIFTYTRKQKVKKKDENGKDIPLKRKVTNEGGEETEVVVEGAFEMEEKGFRGSFNVNRVIRTESLSEDHMIVLLDDGHEETQKQPALKNPGKAAVPGNIVEEKTRVWIQSEINLTGDDIQRYFDFVTNPYVALTD